MIPFIVPENQPIPQWRPTEITLTSQIERENPLAEIEVDVDFTSAAGTHVRRPAFWDGGATWRVRFAPTETGEWRWTSVCTDQDDAGLNGVSGTITCVENKGETPIDKHGFIRVGPDHRHFEHADGTPFFWLGDTHWLMPDTERIDECNHPAHNGGECPFGGQFQHLAAVRREQGFTVYQLYPEVGRPHWWSDESRAHLDPTRFQKVFDREMDHLASLGFVMAVGLGHYSNSIHIPKDVLCRWARYVTARYGAHPVVWITCQEMNCPSVMGDVPSNDQSVWEDVAKEIDRANGHRFPHSAHQWVVDPDVRPVWQAPWHTWFALQGGHRGSGLTPLSRYRAYRECEPIRPVLETEAMYEKVDCGGVADESDARRACWRAFLAGCGGFTYGGAGIWALKWDAADTAWKTYNYEVSSWYEGMELPAAHQMKTIREFLESFEWTAIEPRFDDPAWSQFDDSKNTVVATIGGNRRYLVFFQGPKLHGELRGLQPGAHYRLRWINTRTCKPHDDGMICKASQEGTFAVPSKPNGGDWLLDFSLQ